MFGISSFSTLVPPEVPEGTTQEEAYIGSEEFKAAYDKFARDVDRLEAIGFVAAARDPILIEFTYPIGDPMREQLSKESDEIADTAIRLGFTPNETYPESTIEAQRIAFIAEKSAKFFPEGLGQINQFAADCIKRTGHVGGAAIDAEIKTFLSFTSYIQIVFPSTQVSQRWRNVLFSPHCPEKDIF